MLLAGLPGAALAGVSLLGTVATGTEASGAQSSWTLAFTAAAGEHRLLVVTTGGAGDSVHAPSVTFGGNALTQGIVHTAGNRRLGIWYLPLGSSSTATTAHVVVSYGANFPFDVTALVFQGVDQTTPVSGAVSNHLSSLAVVSSVGDLVLDAIWSEGSRSTAGPGQTLRARHENPAFGAGGTAVSTEPGGAVVAMDWTELSGNVIHTALNLRQVSAGPFAITTPSVITGTVNAPYLYGVSAAGGSGAGTFSVTAGALPSGLHLSAGGTIHGTPSLAGTYHFTVTATDTLGATDSRRFTLNVLGHAVVARTPTATAITATTAVLGGSVTADGFPSLATRGVAYARTAANANPFPVGNRVTTVTSIGTTGAFTVNATGLLPATEYSYRVFATNTMGTVYSAVGTFTTLERSQFHIDPITLPNPGLNDFGYRHGITASGGSGSYTFSVTSGTLPPGLVLSGAGTLSGAATTAGTFTFTVTATDTDGAVDSRAFTLVVGPPGPLAVGTFILPNPGRNDIGYSQPIVAIGGSGSYTFSVTSGALPPGLTLSRTGLLNGAATTPGTYKFTVAISDAATGAVVSPTYTLAVAGAVPVAITTSSLDNSTLGGPYAAAIEATGGTGPYTFLASGGAVPPGLGLTTGGILRGIPTTAGTYRFTVVATDSLGATASQTLSLVVSPTALTAQTITFGALANKRTTDAPFALVATASSGLPVSFSVLGPATINGTMLTLSGLPGPVLITATQVGNATFAAAPGVTQIFTVTVPTDRLINLSARVRIAPDPGRSLIAGFVIGGTQSKRVLVRAVGPTLSAFGVAEALVNPRLQIFDSAGAVILENDDWTGADTAAAFTQVNAFHLAPGSRDAALLATLAPGSYTMQITAGTETGIGLAEVYDASADPAAGTQRLVNISTRGMVGADDGILIGGFVIAGDAPKRILVRGIGPQLAVFGVAGALGDPRLAVYRGEVVVAQNDNWSAAQPVDAAPMPASASELSAVALSVGAFPLGTDSLDAAVLVTLPPGAYTAQVAGVGTATGVALVEIYEVP